MFIVGQNNPAVGNDRRKGLIDQLAQQLAQHFASGQNGAAAYNGARPFIDLQKRRQQTAMSTTPSRGANAGRPTAGTALLGGGLIPAGLRAQPGYLAPGAVAHNPSMLNPGTGIVPSATVSGSPPGGPNWAPSGQTRQTVGGGQTSGVIPSAPSTGGGAIMPSGVGAASLANAIGAGNLIPIGGGVFYDPSTGTVMGGAAGAYSSGGPHSGGVQM